MRGVHRLLLTHSGQPLNPLCLDRWSTRIPTSPAPQSLGLRWAMHGRRWRRWRRCAASATPGRAGAAGISLGWPNSLINVFRIKWSGTWMITWGPWILRKVPPSISIPRLRRFALRHPRHALRRHPQAAAAGACAAGELAAGDEAIVVQVQGAEVGGTWWKSGMLSPTDVGNWQIPLTKNKERTGTTCVL